MMNNIDNIDNIDKLIIENLSGDIKLPNSFNYTILNALKKEQKIKQYQFRKIFKSFATTIVSFILCTGIVFAGYTFYEKVWKEPKVYNNIEEYFTEKTENDQKEINERIQESKIISTEQAISIASNIFANLEIKQNITTENVKINPEKFFDYFKIETKEYKIDLAPSGKFYALTNKNFDYNAKDDIIDENTALELSNKIISSLNLENKYSLKFIQYTNGFINNNSYNIWMSSYYETINNLQNQYNCINIFFSIIDNNMIINKIANLDNNFEYQNNDVIITKENAIEIAKTADRNISILDISKIDAELAIERLNAFVYAQEKTSGKEDEYKYEIIDGYTTAYNAYSNEKILRTIWKVKIDYNYNTENARNDKERFGRNYYIDATTGEIIGGSWGQIGY